MINTPVRLNAYPSLTDPRHTSYEITWGALVGWLTSTHSVYAVKDSAPLFNLTEFSGPTAKKAEALGTSCVILDFDHLSALQLCDVYMRLSQYETVWYTTHSITPTDRRVRCVVLLERRVTPNEYEATWQALAALCGHVDTQCKDIGRRYFVPSHAEGTEHWAEHSPGVPYPVTCVRQATVQITHDLSRYTRDLSEALVRAFPEKGERHEVRLDLAGILIKHGWPEQRCVALLECVREQTGWTPPEGESETVVRDTMSKALSGEPVKGFGDLSGKLGRLGVDGPEVLAQFVATISLMGPHQLSVSSKTGKALPLDSNIEMILGEHPACTGALAFDEFRQDIVQVQPMPATVTGRAKHEPTWTDIDATRLGNWICKEYGFNVSKAKVHEQAAALARKHAFHPIRAYLRGLKWDGVGRLSSLFSRYFGAEDSRYMTAVSRMFMIGAVARVMQPGCKLDTAPILLGRQGCGKSRTLAALVPDRDWFSDTKFELGNKDAMIQLQNTWIYEMAELASLKSADVETVKNFMSSATDKFRVPYESRATQHPRQIVFVGSTNGDYIDFKDASGNRRFFPVRVVGTCDADAVTRDRDQLWAEAYEAYTHGEKTYTDTREVEALCQAVQEEHEEQDPWAETIAPYLESLCAATLQVGAGGVLPDKTDPWKGVTIYQILKSAIGKDPKDHTMKDSQRVARIIKILGFVQAPRRYVDGVRTRIYVPNKVKPPDWTR